MAGFVEPYVLAETVNLAMKKSDLDKEKEKQYIKLMNEDADKIEKATRLIDLITNRVQDEPNNSSIRFLQSEKEVLDEVRAFCPTITEQNRCEFTKDHLAKISETLHRHINNIYSPHSTEIQTVMTQEKYVSNAIFECMVNITKRYQHFMERIAANMNVR